MSHFIQTRQDLSKVGRVVGEILNLKKRHESLINAFFFLTSHLSLRTIHYKQGSENQFEQNQHYKI